MIKHMDGMQDHAAFELFCNYAGTDRHCQQHTVACPQATCASDASSDSAAKAMRARLSCHTGWVRQKGDKPLLRLLIRVFWTSLSAGLCDVVDKCLQSWQKRRLQMVAPGLSEQQRTAKRAAKACAQAASRMVCVCAMLKACIGQQKVGSCAHPARQSSHTCKVALSTV